MRRDVTRRTGRRHRSGAAAIVAVGFCLATTQPAAGQSTERLSTTTGGSEMSGNSSRPSMSRDGRFVAFETAAGEFNDVSIRDRANGTVRTLPEVGGSPAVSDDGRFVAFRADRDIIASDTNDVDDVYVWDWANGTTTRVSVTDGEQQADKGSFAPVISADGRFVAFLTSASNLISTDTNSTTDVYIRDRRDGTTRRVSVTDAEGQANGPACCLAMSPSGQLVAFASEAGNLIGSDGNGTADVYVRDRTSGTTRRASVTDSGGEPNAESLSPAISDDGRFVAFTSRATNLIGSSDTNGQPDVYVRDRAEGRTRRVSVTDGEAQANDDSGDPAISADGQFVAFESDATNMLGGNDTNGEQDVFVRDRTNGITRFASVTNTPGGGLANADSGNPAISGDGRFVVFDSFANNLVVGDAESVFDQPFDEQDVFVRDRGAFGRRTRVRLSLPGRRAIDAGRLRVLVRNGNGFLVRVELSAATTRRVKVGERVRRVRTAAKAFTVERRSTRTVELRLPGSLRRLPSKQRRLSLRLTAVVTGPAGNTRTVERRVRPTIRGNAWPDIGG